MIEYNPIVHYTISQLQKLEESMRGDEPDWIAVEIIQHDINHGVFALYCDENKHLMVHKPEEGIYECECSCYELRDSATSSMIEKRNY